jgi:hydroxymethylbilane synthase
VILNQPLAHNEAHPTFVNPGNSSKAVVIVSRGSALALAQANMVLAQCRVAFPGEQFELRIIKTTGDKLQTASLASANLPKGLFTKELETALLNGEGDLAVHSLKDLPTELPAGLKLGAVSPRADVRDVLIRRRADMDSTSATIDSLPHGATVATNQQHAPPRAATASPPRSQDRGNPW